MWTALSASNSHERYWGKMIEAAANAGNLSAAEGWFRSARHVILIWKANPAVDMSHFHSFSGWSTISIRILLYLAVVGAYPLQLECIPALVHAHPHKTNCKFKRICFHHAHSSHSLPVANTQREHGVRSGEVPTSSRHTLPSLSGICSLIYLYI